MPLTASNFTNFSVNSCTYDANLRTVLARGNSLGLSVNLTGYRALAASGLPEVRIVYPDNGKNVIDGRTDRFGATIEALNFALATPALAPFVTSVGTGAITVVFSESRPNGARYAGVTGSHATNPVIVIQTHDMDGNPFSDAQLKGIVLHEVFHLSPTNRHPFYAQSYTQNHSIASATSLSTFLADHVNTNWWADDPVYGKAATAVLGNPSALGLSSTEAQALEKTFREGLQGEVLRQRRLLQIEYVLKKQELGQTLTSADVVALRKAGVITKVAANETSGAAASAVTLTKKAQEEYAQAKALNASGAKMCLASTETVGELLGELVASGQVTNATARAEMLDKAASWGVLGQTLGSQIGVMLAGDNKVVAGVSGAVFGQIGLQIGRRLAQNPTSILSAVKGGVEDTLTARGLGTAITGAGVGFVSSTITSELRQALKAHGAVGDVFEIMSGSVVNTVVNNVYYNGVGHAFDGFNRSGFWNTPEITGGELMGGAGAFATAAVASFLGAKLGAMIVSPQTQAASTLSSLGSATGAWAFSTAGISIGSQTLGASLFGNSWLAANFVAPGVGALVGFVLGALVGNLFGKKKPKTPTASAETQLQAPTARYEIGAITANSTGNKDLVLSMATSARDTLNALIGVASFDRPSMVSNLNGVATDQIYGHNGNLIYVKINGAQTNFDSPDEAVGYGSLTAIKNTQIIGGDILVKRAISRSGATELTALMGDIQTAADFRSYLQNRAFIDAELSKGWGSLTAGEKTYYDQNTALVNAVFAMGDKPLSPTDQSAYNANKAMIDAIVAKGSTSFFSASWAATLARAGELQLDKYAASDLYGGLRGFLESFQHDGNLEAISLDWNAGTNGLVLTADPRMPDGLFADLADATQDGRSVTISDMFALGYQAGPSAGNDVKIYGPIFTAVQASFQTGDDIAVGGFGDDSLHGNTGADWLDGNNGNDTLLGGQGNDALLGRDGADYLSGDAGDDYAFGGSGADTVIGGDGADTVGGGGHNDSISGLAGADVLLADYNDGVADTLDGGADADQVSYERFAAGVNVNLASGTVFGDTLQNIEGLRGSKFADTLTAAAAGGLFEGLLGDDSIAGGGGADTLDGGLGADTLAGGGGVDMVSYATSASGVHIDLSNGDAFGGDAERDVLSGIEDLRGSRYSDNLTGTSAVNRIEGMAGADWIVATTGADTYDGGDGQDFVDYSTATSGVTLNLGGYYGATLYNGYGTGGLASGHTYIKVEGVAGSAFADNITAGDGAQILAGGKGNDLLNGGAGGDTYVFGRGDGQDTVTEDTTGWNTIAFGDDVLFQDLLIGTAGGSGGYIDFYIRGTSEKIRIAGNWENANLPKLKAIDLGGAAKLDLDQALNAVAFTDGADDKWGVDGYGDLLFGLNGDDVMRTRASGLDQASHVFVGGCGSDLMYGSTGDDSYGVDRDTGLTTGQVQFDTIIDTGGEDTLVFGPSVKAEDLLYEVMNGSLYIGVRDAANPALTASQVQNRVLVMDGGTRYHNIDSGITRFGSKAVEYVQVDGASIDIRKLDLPWHTVYETNPIGPGPIPPIVLDLDGDGIDLTTLEESRIVAKTAKGVIQKIGWVGPRDAFLAVDRNGDGAINHLTEISFVQDKKGAKTDLDGLTAWDTTGDGKLDAADKDFGKLLVWTDKNQNGRSTKGELKTLKEAGITALNLKGEATGFDASTTEESHILNTFTYQTADGKGGQAYDVALSRQLINAEGGYSGDKKLDQVDLAGDAELGVLLNDPKADAAKAAGKAIDKALAVDKRTLSYDAVAAAAKLDFKDGDGISAEVRKQWDYKLDPTKYLAWKESQKLSPTSVTSLEALAKTPASPDRKVAAVQGAASVEEAVTPKSSTRAASPHVAAEGVDIEGVSIQAEGVEALVPQSPPEALTPALATAAPEGLAPASSARVADEVMDEPSPAAAWWRAEGAVDVSGGHDLRTLMARLDRGPTETASEDGVAPEMLRRRRQLMDAVAGFGGAAGAAPAIWLRSGDRGGDIGLTATGWSQSERGRREAVG